MAQICEETQEWVEEQIEEPIIEWEKRQKKKCEEEPCIWWLLCLNKLICWLVWITVKVVRWVTVTVGKWVTRMVCELVSVVVDLGAMIVNLILSIPGLGGLLRTLLNWVTEIVWRLVTFPDFLASLGGIQPRKKMYFGLLIPREDGNPITTEAAMMHQIDYAKDAYDRLCNIELIYTGACVAPFDADPDTLRPVGGVAGFFLDWSISGSYLEAASALCKFDGGWRRVTGYGGELIVVPVIDVLPDPAEKKPGNPGGRSFGSTHNYLFVEAGAGSSATAHEMGHSCDLTHYDDDESNLMHRAGPDPSGPTLTNFQVSVVRNSKHCVYV